MLLFQPAPQLTGTLTLNAAEPSLPLPGFLDSLPLASPSFSGCTCDYKRARSTQDSVLTGSVFKMTVTAPLSASHWRIHRLYHPPFSVLSKDLLEVVTLLTVPHQRAAQCPTVLRTAPASYCFSSFRRLKSSVKKIK